jgi:hypothetical protein
MAPPLHHCDHVQAQQDFDQRQSYELLLFCCLCRQQVLEMAAQGSSSSCLLVCASQLTSG